MSREAEEAQAIQQALLPRTSPLIPGFRVSGLSIPAGSVGGDWYDFIPLPDGRWGLVLADVSGKGTAAPSHVRHSRHAALARANRLWTRRGSDASQQHDDRRFSQRPLRHHGVCRTRPVDPRSADRERRPSRRCWSSLPATAGSITSTACRSEFQPANSRRRK